MGVRWTNLKFTSQRALLCLRSSNSLVFPRLFLWILSCLFHFVYNKSQYLERQMAFFRSLHFNWDLSYFPGNSNGFSTRHFNSYRNWLVYYLLLQYIHNSSNLLENVEKFRSTFWFWKAFKGRGNRQEFIINSFTKISCISSRSHYFDAFVRSYWLSNFVYSVWNYVYCIWNNYE